MSELCDTQRCKEIGYFYAGWLASDGWALLYSLPGHALFSNDTGYKSQKPRLLL